MTRRNWGAFYRAQQTRAQEALALGQHRPPPLVVEQERAAQDQHNDQAPDQEDDRD